MQKTVIASKANFAPYALGFYREALKAKARLAQSLSRNDGL
jgi:hypothetical protein